MPLRDVIESDLPIFFEYQSDPEACRMAGFQSREHDAFMKHWREKILGSPTATMKAVLFEGRVAGNIGSWDQGGERLIAYWVARELWGRGIASAALNDYLKVDTRRPLHASVVAHNLGSQRVLEKAGFRKVGSEKGDDGVEELFFRLDA